MEEQAASLAVRSPLVHQSSVSQSRSPKQDAEKEGKEKCESSNDTQVVKKWSKNIASAGFGRRENNNRKKENLK